MSAVAFIVIAILTLVSALAAAVLPRLIHAALCLVAAFLGVAAFYIFLGAEFVGLVQVLVYVGAVAVLVVFTILLTRTSEEKSTRPDWAGALIAVAVFAGLAWAILKTASPPAAVPQVEMLTVKRIGEALMADYIWPLQCAGVLLTAALIGAVVLVMEEKR